MREPYTTPHNAPDARSTTVIRGPRRILLHMATFDTKWTERTGWRGLAERDFAASLTPSQARHLISQLTAALDDPP